MIKFIYGNPGTGKTETIFKMLEDDARSNKKALLIVPEQMTVSTERELIKRLPPSAQLHIEVLNYTRLANKLFREHGGIAYNFSSRGLQKLLMWRAIMIATPLLSEYCRSGNDDIALADSFLATYNELTAAGISLEELEKISLTQQDSTLVRKIKDIVTICSIYSSLLTTNYSDTNGELIRLAALLKNTDCFKNVNVYFDGFSSITGVEHSITRSIFSQADNCTVTIGLPSPTYKGLDTVSIKDFSDRLRGVCAALGTKTETVILTENHRTDSPYLKYLSDDLWEISSEAPPEFPTEADDSIQLYRAADIYDECEYAAVLVRELVESGYRYNEIAIIARNSEKYSGIIEPALENMDIPYFISEKSDPSLCPLSKLILSALKVTIFGWQRNDVISHLKTGLCGISPREADIFEAYTAKWNISGKKFTSTDAWNMNPDGYTTQKTERGNQVLQIANSVKETLVKRLMTYSSELKSATDCREMSMATVRYLESSNVKEHLKSLAAKYIDHNKPRQAAECIRMYDVVLDALDCVCDAFAEHENFDLAKFYTAVKTALEESELGSIPTSMDEITVGSANMIRTDNVKCTILLGVCDGEFPSSGTSNGLLNDSDREYLIKHNVMLSGDREMRASDELYYFRRAASSPSKKLIIFTRADAEPSIAFTRIRKIFNHIPLTETTSQLLPRFRTLKSITEYLPLYEDTDLGEALKRLSAEYNTDGTIVAHPSNSLSAENDTVSAQTISERLGSEIRLSQSRIEEFVRCKFAYSCKYYLKLEENKRISFAYNDIGSFVHKVLEKFLFHLYVINKGVIPEDKEKSAIINEIIDSYIAELIPDTEKAGARLMHLIDRLKKMSLLLLDDILTELSDGDFIPTFFEFPIGYSDTPSITISLKDGKKLSLNGIADRIDVFEKEGKAYIRVIDYKTGNKTFSLSDIKEGKNLQLLIYLFSLTSNNSIKLFNENVPVAAGITYISAGGSGKVKSARYDSEDESLRAATGEIKRSGLILDEDDIIHAVSHSNNNRYLMASSKKKSTISRQSFSILYDQVCGVLKDIGNEMLTGNANAIPKDGDASCQYCPYSWICRASKKKQK